MAVTTSRLVGVVVAMAILGAAAGYGVGQYTQPELPAAAGEARPLAATSGPISPTPKMKVPKPTDTKALDPDELAYRTQSFTAEAAVDSAITVDVPRGWTMTRPELDEARYTDSEQQRWIRVESGYKIKYSTSDEMRRQEARLANVAPENDLRMLSKTNGALIHRDGTRLTISTMVYTYIPEETERYVLVRWVGFGSPGYSEVVIGVTGLRKDKKALEAILDRATKSVRRTD